MTRSVSKVAAAVALAACTSMTAVPAMAAPLPAPTQSHGAIASTAGGWTSEDDTVQARRWDRYGRYPYYGRYHRHRGGVDAGDVLAGVLVLGGIAAIASAASNANKNRDYRDRDYRTDDYRYRNDDYRDQDYNYRDSAPDGYASGRGLDRAVDMCVAEIERGDRVDSVEGVDRSASGWRVEGYLRDGRNFSCAIDSDGRVRGIEYGRR